MTAIHDGKMFNPRGLKRLRFLPLFHRAIVHKLILILNRLIEFSHCIVL